MMQRPPTPIAKDLVLIGGGHSHAIALRKFAMSPIAGVRITLITDVSHTPYSGMLPGYVAGLYGFDDCHIDLRPLAQFAGVQLILSRAVGLDLKTNRVLLADRPPVAFDLVSIDIGSTPAALGVPGANDHAIPVKPISKFLHYWEQVVERVTQTPNLPFRVAIVGGGAGGVELALSIQSRLHSIYQASTDQASTDQAAQTQTSQQPHQQLELHLVQRGDRLLPERNTWLGKRLQQILTQRGIQVHLREEVVAVEASTQTSSHEEFSQSSKIIRCKSGLVIPCDYLFWVTQASAAPWLRESGLATDRQGFIQISDTLQSVSHPQVFAAGDVATMVNHSRPKAGVFAVRQGKPLYDNLRRALLEQPLRPFVPQREFLILIGTGDRSALASRGAIHVGPHPLIWRWKDWIDRQFMNQFSDLEPMDASSPKRDRSSGNQSSRPDRSSRDQSFRRDQLHLYSPMHCAGCGSKVGSSVLERVLNRIQHEQPSHVTREDILIGLDAPDDAAVVTIPPDQVMVQTIDQFRALVNDPFIFGQICANHCLSDLFAMGADPQSALAIATLPYATEPKLEESLYQLLSGAVKALHQTHAVLIGGHTTEGSELSFGLSCNGLADPNHLWRKRGMEPGQALILTKAIGTGTLFAADMRLRAKGHWIEGAIHSMLLSNQGAVSCLRNHHATACTDVTGFGLLGHLVELIRASQVEVELDLNSLPVLEGAKETVQQGIHSSLYPQNHRAARFLANHDQAESHPLYPLLFDPQTSGGLLASVPADRASACVSALKAIGYAESRVIGTVVAPSAEPSVRVKL